MEHKHRTSSDSMHIHRIDFPNIIGVLLQGRTRIGQMTTTSGTYFESPKIACGDRIAFVFLKKMVIRSTSCTFTQFVFEHRWAPLVTNANYGIRDQERPKTNQAVDYYMCHGQKIHAAAIFSRLHVPRPRLVTHPRLVPTVLAKTRSFVVSCSMFVTKPRSSFLTSEPLDCKRELLSRFTLCFDT